MEWSTDSNGNAIIYPRIQEVRGELKFFSGPDAYKRAIENKNYLIMTPEEVEIFFAKDPKYGTAYKSGWPQFFDKFQQGGSINVIPDGALHARKHNMDMDGITKKGIPVVSENKDGEIEQQAEIEKEEIILRLEVTQKLEKLAKEGTEEAALENDDIRVTIGFEELPAEVKNPTKRLIDMSGIEEGKAKNFMKSLQAFKKLRDKFSTEDDVRKIRRGVTSVFFEIYREVAKRAIINGNRSKLVEMFINFGYMDDELLTPNQIMDLYEIKDKSKTKRVNVYYIDEWLQKIYDKDEPPSVNGFGQDYREALRELKKRGTISDKELEEHWESSSKRLEYEVDNMIETTHRLCYGQVSVYFPILHKDMITKDLERALIRRDVMEKSIKEITDIDFSAFYREVLYKNKELNIEKELVMQEVLPNIILMPTFGSRAIMWEELSSRQKNSTGRFLFPIFTSEEIESLLLPTIGAFRWELCKTMLGPAWNDITQMSITSEYSDYVQFYKKNRNLSDESKEKLKIQIKKCRNNLREVFVSDYNLWIRYESKGIMRLNRVARGILYRQVPFAKNIRDELSKQPMFSEIANRFKNIRNKKATELENRYFKFTKTGNPLPPELQHHIEFYKDM